MKIDLSQEFTNADDTPATDAVTKEPITLKHMLIQALLSETTENSEKVKRYSLYRDIKKSKVGFVLLNAEDVAFLKKVMLVFPTLVVGQAHDMLETNYIEKAQEAAVKDILDL